MEFKNTRHTEKMHDPQKHPRNQKQKFHRKPKKWEHDKNEIDKINLSLENVDINGLQTFQDYPISKKTKLGLTQSKYIKPTEIQKESILLALKGHDILGSAKTGSGKTLAFLIPVLENLYRANWTTLDGLGALIISPTRELAYQTFEVLKRIGKNHDFSAGIVIGGKDLSFEKQKIYQTNILVCTPGRLLQHLEQTSFFACDNLQILVLDEADRILDLGFQTTINAILESIPKERQTLLFSATQTKSVKDLARLSLKEPMLVSSNDGDSQSTPAQLLQTYIVCELHEKLSHLYSFIKTHLHQKILVFLTSCKQVKYIHSVLCRLKPGMSILALYGTMNQLKRVAAYEQFSGKNSAVLLATDIAARGLDFPEVNWVVQMDCPEDANTYIHRVGRTARYYKDGKSLLFLMPSEESTFINYLHAQNIPIKKTMINPQKIFPIKGKLDAECARDVNLKARAQKCFISYLRAIYLMRDKKLFNLQHLNLDAYANSLGLAMTPRIRFLQNTNIRKQNDNTTGYKSFKATATTNIEENEQLLKNQNKLIEINKKYIFENGNETIGDDNDDDIFKVKKMDNFNGSEINTHKSLMEKSNQNNSLAARNTMMSKITQLKKLAKLSSKKNVTLNKRIVFDDEDNAKIEVAPTPLMLVDSNNEVKSQGLDFNQAFQRLREQDKIDKQAYQAKVKLTHKEKRKKAKLIADQKRKRNRNEPLLEKSDNEENDAIDYEEILEDDPQLAEIVNELPDPNKFYEKTDETLDTLKVKKSFKANRRRSNYSENSIDNLEETEYLAKKLLDNI